MKSVKVTLHDLFVLFIVATSLSGFILLLGGQFKSINVILGGFSLVLIFMSIFWDRSPIFVSPSNRKEFVGLLLILALAAVLRSQPSRYIMGGQDQGVYVNYAAWISNHGSLQVVDSVREKISPNHRGWYDQQNQYHLQTRVKSAFEGTHLPGIYIKDLAKSEYVFQFYPLHPIWLSLSLDLFGKQHTTWSLVFFSLLSIVVIYLLAKELSQEGTMAAMIAALLIAINPLHAFFSKFPVSEMVTLFFTSTGLLYLIRYFRVANKLKNPRPFYLIISGLAFFCAFFNHISLFFTVPFFYAIFVICLAWPQKNETVRDAGWYALAVLIGFCASLTFGYYYSYPYFTDVYRAVFAPILGDKWLWLLAGAATLMVVLPITLVIFRKTSTVCFHFFYRYLSRILPLILLLLLCLAIYNHFQYTFTTKYINEETRQFNIVKKYNVTTIFLLASYVTPFAFFIYAISLFKRKFYDNVGIKIILLFLVFSWIIRITFSPYSLYQYYYSRYLLSDLAPYLTVLSALYFSQLYKEGKPYFRKILLVGLSTSTLFSLAFSLPQLKGREAEGAYECIKKMTSRVKDEDLLIIDSLHFALFSEIKTPIGYFFNKNVTYLSHKYFSELSPDAAKFGDFYFLSKKDFDNLHKVDRIDCTISALKRSDYIPTHYTSSKSIYYLYQLDKTPGSLKKLSRTITVAQYKADGFYPDKIWSDGHGVITNIHMRLNPEDRFLKLAVVGNNPYASDLSKVNLTVKVNGVPLEYSNKKDLGYYFRLNEGVTSLDSITIDSKTFIPQELGINTDQRELGIDVSYFIPVSTTTE